MCTSVSTLLAKAEKKLKEKMSAYLRLQSYAYSLGSVGLYFQIHMLKTVMFNVLEKGGEMLTAPLLLTFLFRSSLLAMNFHSYHLLVLIFISLMFQHGTEHKC